jgi:hypothetical protein
LEKPSDDFILIDLKFKGFRNIVIFNLNDGFTINCLKMPLIRVRFSPSPGFFSGAAFPGEQFAPAWFKNY